MLDYNQHGIIEINPSGLDANSGVHWSYIKQTQIM